MSDITRQNHQVNSTSNRYRHSLQLDFLFLSHANWMAQILKGRMYPMAL
jgi:hypothetical protein